MTQPTPNTLNAEYLPILTQGISVLLKQCCDRQAAQTNQPLTEDEKLNGVHLSAHTVSQLETVQQWASDRMTSLDYLAKQDKTTKAQALWALKPCPLSLSTLVQLLQQVNALALDDIGQSYIKSLLVGVAGALGELAHNALYLIALHHRATNPTQQPMPSPEDIWQPLSAIIKNITNNQGATK
ncbi:hypothetical protein [Actinobacillus porcinus]|uniref:hypothetical protein n=1 Tax=Actinobacillus porcinus TaxID=51048 RepID=UPI002A90B7CB|nr:hypothetical protein [Actinobacillus porcinus]MDY6216694.1 hypothetical protein [Actinobacillus porcinus]